MVHPVRAAAVCLALAGCVRNPATGKLELNLPSQSQEIELGKQGAAEREQAIGLYRDPKIEEDVATRGHSARRSRPGARERERGCSSAPASYAGTERRRPS